MEKATLLTNERTNEPFRRQARTTGNMKRRHFIATVRIENNCTRCFLHFVSFEDLIVPICEVTFSMYDDHLLTQARLRDSLHLIAKALESFFLLVKACYWFLMNLVMIGTSGLVALGFIIRRSNVLTLVEERSLHVERIGLIEEQSHTCVRFAAVIGKLMDESRGKRNLGKVCTQKRSIYCR
jgi:hypothetical protein